MIYPHDIFQDPSTKLFGVINNESKEILLDAKYISIERTLNYKDLSLTEFSVVYFLKDDIDSNFEYFAYFKGGVLKKSKSKYIFSRETHMPHFYKDCCFCKRDANIEVIINLNEEVIAGPFTVQKDDDVFYDQLVIDINYSSKEYQTLVDELGRSYLCHTGSNDHLGYGSFIVGSEKSGNFIENRGNTLSIENNLGFSWCEHFSMPFKEIHEFDIWNGLALVKDFNDKYILINKYFYPIGQYFDELLSKERLAELTDSTYDFLDDDKILYLRNGNFIQEVLLTGDFVREVCLNPTLFINNKIIKQYLIEKRFCDSSFNKNDLDIFYKIDDFILERERLTNNLEKAINTNAIEWENQILSSKFLKNHNANSLIEYFPFDISPKKDKQELINAIDEFNNLFGIAYSGYKCMDSVSVPINRIV